MMHIRSEWIIDVFFDVPSVDNQQKILLFAFKLKTERVEVETWGVSPCSYPRVEFRSAASRDEIEGQANKLVRYIKKFKGHKFDP